MKQYKYKYKDRTWVRYPQPLELTVGGDVYVEFCLNGMDATETYRHWSHTEETAYDGEHCSCCYLNIGHSVALHNARVAASLQEKANS